MGGDHGGGFSRIQPVSKSCLKANYDIMRATIEHSLVQSIRALDCYSRGKFVCQLAPRRNRSVTRKNWPAKMWIAWADLNSQSIDNRVAAPNEYIPAPIVGSDDEGNWLDESNKWKLKPSAKVETSLLYI